MTYVLIVYMASREPLVGAADAGELFDDSVTSILNHGGSGQSLWVGPAEAPHDPNGYRNRSWGMSRHGDPVRLTQQIPLITCR